VSDEIYSNGLEVTIREFVRGQSSSIDTAWSKLSAEVAFESSGQPTTSNCTARLRGNSCLF
jgi:hypothetical protein